MKRSNLSIIVFTLTALSFFALALYSTARSESPIDTKTGPESRGDDATSQDPKRQPTPEINGVILGQGLLKVLSFYDGNANGILDPSDSELVNWPITISPLGIVKLTPVSVDLSSSLNPYTLTEGVPLQTNWVQSTSDSITVNVVE